MESATTQSIFNKEQVLQDFYTCALSREISLIGRKEVHSGKANFGIFGDGKELPQIAMAKVFQKGDWRSGYYRDQTFALATKAMEPEQFFAQLYAHANKKAEPMSGGRQMSGHFSTKMLDERGNWLPQTSQVNIATDLSPTGSQMPRLLGLAQASKLYKSNKKLNSEKFSNDGQEIAFGTIGNASSAEGMFFETINAAAVLQVPVLISIWDDGYGISVANDKQVAKDNIGEALSGFKRENGDTGIEILTVKGWDYPALVATYEKANALCREQHVPVVVHVTELTQPQGHSSSGSHERYKTKERLDWEAQHDCLLQFKYWIEDEGFATSEELKEIEKEAKGIAKTARKAAWAAVSEDKQVEIDSAVKILDKLIAASSKSEEIEAIKQNLLNVYIPQHHYVLVALRRAYWVIKDEKLIEEEELRDSITYLREVNQNRFNTHVYAHPSRSSLSVRESKPRYSLNSDMVDGRIVLNEYFKQLFERDERVVAFGEDVGRIGDVNKAFDGLQDIFGEDRIFDTGIREQTIIGQGVGLALRGFRPIAEIQYLDYIYYALSLLSDDLACLHYRSAGSQIAPLIVRTRGHRLEGIWHAGSPMGTLISSLRGMHICVPRDMTRAAGMYNTLLKGDEPALMIESLNGYRLKEKLPTNLAEYCIPLGVPETLKKGLDITVVTYGSMCRIVMEAAEILLSMGIDIEVIDVQTLLPLDRVGTILESVKKTNKLLIADEDMPGAASGFIMHHVMETQRAWKYMDAQPRTLTARPHRPAYATDGDYFTKPNVEDVVEFAYSMMQEYNPEDFPPFYTFPVDFSK